MDEARSFESDFPTQFQQFLKSAYSQQDLYFLPQLYDTICHEAPLEPSPYSAPDFSPPEQTHERIFFLMLEQ
jgi:hypothetical protein